MAVALGVQHLLQVADDRRHGHQAQVELQAARQDRHRHLLRIGGREQELHVRRRLLERLEERVEAVRREHVHLVDEVHLVAPPRRRVGHVVQQLAGLVDTGARGRVHLDQVDEATRVDLAAGAAGAAGLAGDAVRLAVQALRQDTRDGRLADAARAGEQECVMYTPLGQPVGQGPDHLLLAHQLGKLPGPPLARENLITQ